MASPGQVTSPPPIEPERSQVTLNHVKVATDEEDNITDPEKTTYDDPEEKNPRGPEEDSKESLNKTARTKRGKGRGAFRSEAKNGLYVAHFYEPVSDVCDAKPYTTHYRYKSRPYTGGYPYEITERNAYNFQHSLDKYKRGKPIRKYDDKEKKGKEEKVEKEEIEEKQVKKNNKNERRSNRNGLAA